MQILNDFNTSVRKALEEIDPNWMDYTGLIICGTHTPVYEQDQIDLITKARNNFVPFLGICFGHQLAAIEYARTILKIEDATSEEFESEGTFVVKKGEKLNVGQVGGETYWNNYVVDHALVPNFEQDKPPHFLTCQYHPEYQSSKNSPHALLVKFLKLCKNP